MRSGHADVLDQLDLRPRPKGRLAGLLGHGQIARAGGDNRHFARRVVLGLLVRFAFSTGSVRRNAERAADRVVTSGRESVQQFGSLDGRHAGRQHVGPVGQQRGEDLFHGRDGLAFGKNDFRKAAAAMAIKIDLGVAHVGDLRSAGLLDELVQRELAGQKLCSELVQFVVRHDSK